MENEKLEERGDGLWASIAGCCGAGFRYPSEFRDEPEKTGKLH
jgi:hypothetical protein